jgi:hypothetical protein
LLTGEPLWGGNNPVWMKASDASFISRSFGCSGHAAANSEVGDHPEKAPNLVEQDHRSIKL